MRPVSGVLTVVTALATIGLCVAVAPAEPFVNPPEVNYDAWVTPYPYQRNILIGFDTDPHTWPDHITSPVTGARKALTPSVVHHQGTDDGQLYPSDWVGGQVEPAGGGGTGWLETDTITGTAREGILAMYVDDPNTTVTLTWHIDNWDRPNEKKNVFLEAEYYSTGNMGFDEVISSTGQIEPLTPHEEDLPDGWVRWNSWATLTPNPPWEELVNHVTFETGQTPGMLLMDYVHIATECVPEPATCALLGLGGLVILRKKRSR